MTCMLTPRKFKFCQKKQRVPGFKIPTLRPSVESRHFDSVTCTNCHKQRLFSTIALSLAPCKATGCRLTRIHKGCGRWMCKAHCIEASGSSLLPHKGSQPPQALSTTVLLPPLPSSFQLLDNHESWTRH